MTLAVFNAVYRQQSELVLTHTNDIIIYLIIILWKQEITLC